MTSVQEIEMSHTDFTSLPQTLLMGLTHLEVLEMDSITERDDLRQVSREIKKAIENGTIDSLRASNPSRYGDCPMCIKSLPACLFYDNPNLVEIDRDDMVGLDSLPLSMFARLPKLKALEVHQSRHLLDFLEYDALGLWSDAPKLQGLSSQHFAAQGKDFELTMCDDERGNKHLWTKKKARFRVVARACGLVTLLRKTPMRLPIVPRSKKPTSVVTPLESVKST